MRNSLKVILIAAQLVSVAAPQAPPPITSKAEEVVLDVIVRDKKNKPVRDLSPADFQVSDNGTVRKLTSVRLVDSGAHLIALVFEPLPADGRRLARQAALDFLKEMPPQNLYCGVFMINNRLSALQEFTDNKDLLKAAIEKATSGAAATTYITQSEAIRAKLQSEAATGGAEVRKSIVDVMLRILRFDASMASEESARLAMTSLTALAQAQMSFPGRKAIIYINQGFTIPINLDEMFQNVISTANRANVAIYPVDARGLITTSENQRASADLTSAAGMSKSQLERRPDFTPSFTTPDEVRSQERGEEGMRSNQRIAVETLARSTGAFLVTNTNDFRAPLHRITEDISAYYEISYDPQIDNYDGSFRKTDVHVNRADVKLQARSGYYALPVSQAASGLMPYEVSLIKALSANPLPKDIEFRSAAYRFQTGPAGAREAFVVEIPMKNVTFTVDDQKKTYKARISLVALLKDANGALVQKFNRDLPLQGTTDKLAGVQAANFTYKEQYSLPPGRYTFETAVMDREGNKLGARKTAVVVTPKQPGVEMSNIALVRNYQPNAASLDPGDPFQFQGGRIVPSVSPNIRGGKGSQLAMFFVVYPDPAVPDKPQIVLEYIKDGTVVGRGEVPLPAADANGRIPYVMSSSAEVMTPGAYEIHAVAKQGSSTTEERTFITVE